MVVEKRYAAYFVEGIEKTLPQILCLIDPGDVMKWASTFAVSLIESTPFCEDCLA